MLDLVFPALAHAEEAAPTISDTINSSFSTIAGDAMSAIGSTLPVILPVMGAIVVIGVAVRLFKRFVK